MTTPVELTHDELVTLIDLLHPEMMKHAGKEPFAASGSLPGSELVSKLIAAKNRFTR